MTSPSPLLATLARRLAEFRLCLAFFTRLPGGPAEVPGMGALAPALWSLPLVGVLVGALAGAAYGAAGWIGLPPVLAAALALALLLLVTGCFHEDGLADTADGLGGGWTRERKLEIMRDSRLGTYGAAALVLTLLLRWGALAALAGPGRAAAALIAAEAASRALLPAALALLPLARQEGLSASAGRPPSAAAQAALALGLLALLLCLGWGGGLLALLLLLVVAAGWARLCLKQIGGYTGDTLGALQQGAVVAVLLAAVATA